MKKLVLTTFVLVVAITFLFAAFQFPVTFAGRICPNVGWNTSACATNASAEIVHSVSFLSHPPVFTPYVGWNT